MTRHLGGKGANQSVAIAKAGGRVTHIGAVGTDGVPILEGMVKAGVDVDCVVMREDCLTGQAIIQVDSHGENVITLDGGANVLLDCDQISGLLQSAGSGDILVMQNETNGVEEFARLAKSQGISVVWSAAPFDADLASKMIPLIDLLVLNKVEMEQLQLSAGSGDDLTQIDRLVTAGSSGANYYEKGEKPLHTPAIHVDPVDTTGAGDTFIGTCVAERHGGKSLETAMERASATAALHVTRPGTADAIPTRQEVDAWLAS